MTEAHRIVFVFVDGLGLGDIDLAENPLRDAELSILANFHEPGWLPTDDGGRPSSLPEVLRTAPLPFGGQIVATDPSMGVAGLPQSATGQTAIFTGENAAQIQGRHLYGYPRKTLQEVLMRASIMKRLNEDNRKAIFVNAFRQIFFELGDSVWKKPLSATTWANRAAGLPFMTIEDLRAGRAVYQDITHKSLRTRKTDIALREPEEAGSILAKIASVHQFTLFEFFQTDKAGHAQDGDKAVRELRKLERFLQGALEALDLETTTVVATSDHGNIEDLSRKMHTHNMVPTLVFGKNADELAPRLGRLEYMTPVLLEYLGVGTPEL